MVNVPMCTNVVGSACAQKGRGRSQYFEKMSVRNLLMFSAHFSSRELGTFLKFDQGLSKLYVRKIFQKSDITSPLIPTHTCAYQGVKNISFSEKFACVLPRWFLTKTLFYVYVPDKNIQIKKGGSPGKTNRRDRNGYYNEVSLKYFSFFLSVNIRLLPYYSNIASYRSTNKPTNKR